MIAERNDAEIMPPSSSVVLSSSPFAAAQKINGGNRRHRSQKRSQRRNKRKLRREDQRQDGSQRRAARNSQHERIGQRIAQQRLKTCAGNGQRRSHQDSQQNARQSQIKNDEPVFRGKLVAASDGDAPEIHDQVGHGNRHRAQLQREHHARQQHGGEPAAGPQHIAAPSAGACAGLLGRVWPDSSAGTPRAANVSGCSARASCSMASTMRGAGRMMASLMIDDVPVPQRVQIAPAGTRAQRVDIVAACLPRARSRKPEIPAAGRTISSRLTCGHSSFVSTTERAPARRSASAMNVSRPMEISGSVQTTKSTRRGAVPARRRSRSASRARSSPASAAAALFRSQNAANALNRRDHLVHRMRIGDIHRQSQAVQSVHSFAAVDGRRQDQVRAELHDFFQVRIHRAAHVRLLRRFRRIIAKVRVPGQMISCLQSENNFSQIRRQRNDAVHLLRNIHAPPGFVRERARQCLRAGSWVACATALRAERPRATNQQDISADPRRNRQALPRCQNSRRISVAALELDLNFIVPISRNKKAPRESGARRPHPFSRRVSA